VLAGEGVTFPAAGSKKLRQVENHVQ
jgi:hypothetical protein